MGTLLLVRVEYDDLDDDCIQGIHRHDNTSDSECRHCWARHIINDILLGPIRRPVYDQLINAFLVSPSNASFPL